MTGSPVMSGENWCADSCSYEIGLHERACLCVYFCTKFRTDFAFQLCIRLACNHACKVAVRLQYVYIVTARIYSYFTYAFKFETFFSTTNLSFCKTYHWNELGQAQEK